MPQLDGKVVFITGVSSGLGRAIAAGFVAAGAIVIGTARRAALGAELASELGSDRFFFEAGDISQFAECERLVDRAVEIGGRLDVLVNNAAVRTDPPLMALHTVDEANWDAVCNTNLKGPFFLTRFALAPMRAQRSGVILNIASSTAEIAVAGMAPYVTTKAGLVQLTRVTAVEYVEDGVRANAILLGGTNTGQASRTAAAKAGSGGRVDALPPENRAPSSMLSPPEVARTLVMLSSDDAATITGASIAVDHAATAGGWASNWTHLNIAHMAAGELT